MDVFNAFKGIADMIRDAVEGAMPRQAVVTRSEGSGVWVRYTPVNADSPEMWFPSSIADLPAGTSGWVHPLAGGKGRFIATAVRVPSKPQRGRSTAGQTVSTAGDYAFTTETALLTFSGLTPGVSYELSWTVQLNWWTTASAKGHIAVRVTDAGGTNFHIAQLREMRLAATGTSEDKSSWSYSATVTARPDGTVQVCPAFRWNAGTTYFQYTYILARID